MIMNFTKPSYEIVMDDLQTALLLFKIPFSYDSNMELYTVTDKASDSLFDISYDESVVCKPPHQDIVLYSLIKHQTEKDEMANEPGKYEQHLTLLELINFLLEDKHDETDKLINFLKEKGIPFTEDGKHIRITYSDGCYLRISEDFDGTFYVRDTGVMTSYSLEELVNHILKPFA